MNFLHGVEKNEVSSTHSLHTRLLKRDAKSSNRIKKLGRTDPKIVWIIFFKGWTPFQDSGLLGPHYNMFGLIMFFGPKFN